MEENFPEQTVEEGILYPVPYPKILSYNFSVFNMKSKICWRTAYGLGLVCSITSASEILSDCLYSKVSSEVNNL